MVVMTAKPLLLGLLVLAAPVVGVLPRPASPVLLVVQIGLDIAVLVVVLTVPNDRLADHQRFQRLLLRRGRLLARRLGRVRCWTRWSSACSRPRPRSRRGPGC